MTRPLTRFWPVLLIAPLAALLWWGLGDPASGVDPNSPETDSRSGRAAVPAVAGGQQQVPEGSGDPIGAVDASLDGPSLDPTGSLEGAPGDPGSRSRTGVPLDPSAAPAPVLPLRPGRILDASNGRPVAEAEIELASGEGTHRARSDDQGRFELPWPEGQRGDVRIQAPGYAAIRLPDAEPAFVRELTLPALGSIQGTLSGLSPADPVFDVGLWRLEGRPLDGPPLSQQRAERNHEFRFEGLEPGLYAVVAELPRRAAEPGRAGVPAFATETRRAQFSGLRVESHANRRIELEAPPLGAWRIATENGSEPELAFGALRLEPIADGFARGVVSDPDGLLGASTEPPTGLAGLDPLERDIRLGFGRYRLTAYSNWADRLVTDLGVGEFDQPVVPRFWEPAFLRGRVETSSELPAGKALVGLVLKDLAQDFKVPWPQAAALAELGYDLPVGFKCQLTLTDEDGWFSFNRVPAGKPLLLTVWPERWPEVVSGRLEAQSLDAPLAVDIGSLPSRKSIPPPRLRLRRHLPLEVDAYLPNGKPAEGARVSIEAAVGGAILPRHSLRADQNGRARFEALLPQDLALSVETDGCLIERLGLPDIDRSGLTRLAQVHIQLRPAARIEGVVVDRYQVAVPRARIVWRSPVETLEAVGDLSGRFRFDRVIPLAGTLEASAWGFNPGPASSRGFFPGNQAGERLVLTPGTLPFLETLRGRIESSERREAVPGLVLRGGGPLAMLSQGASEFTLSGIDPECRRLIAAAPGFEPRELPVEIFGQGQEMRLSGFTLEPQVTLELTPPVTDPDLAERLILVPLDRKTGEPDWDRPEVEFQPFGLRSIARLPRVLVQLEALDSEETWVLDLARDKLPELPPSLGRLVLIP